ncbi:serine-rich adhesin for platelets-like [Xyrauchen texanus]|uniref:serine-rich adhesin for platelets-like n=1 Tax=Xyrauchen texanus TaxID=154827 RepID=UPI002242728D|nr:serine-rich adhesin for platelets-like [Xyrauchen texanus]
MDCKELKDVTSTTPHNSISSLPQSSLSFILKSSSSSIHQSSIYFTPESSSSSIHKSSQSFSSSIPLSSSSSVPQSSTSCILPMSTSVIPDSFTLNSNNTISQSSTSNLDSDSSFPENSNSHQTSIITSKAKDFQTSSVDNRDVFVTNRDVLASNNDHNSITTDTSKPISVLSMPDVILSRTVSSCSNTEYSVDADTNTKPVSSFSNTDVSVLSSVYNVHCNLHVSQSCPEITAHSTFASSLLEKTHSDIYSETISMETYETDNYTTNATDSEKPSPVVVGPVRHNAEPVLLEDGLNMYLPQSVVPRVHTIINSTKTATYDLSSVSDPDIPDPEHSWRGLSNNMSSSDVVTLSEMSAQDHITQERIQDISTSSHEIVHTFSDFPDNGISNNGSSEALSNIIILPSSHSKISQQLFSSLAPEVETNEVCVEDQPYVTEVHFVNVKEAHLLERSKSHKLIGQNETAAERLTKLNDLQMFVKEKYGPEKDGLNYIYNKYETTAECMTSVNDLQMFVMEKYGPEEEESNGLHVFSNKNDEITLNQEKDIKSEQSLTREQSIDDLELRCIMDEKSRVWMSHAAQEEMLLHKVVEKYEGTEEKTEALQMVQSMTEASKTQGVIELEAEVCGDTEVLTDQAEQQIPCLDALKPVLPVNQECSLEECTLAPTFSEIVKVSLADSSMATNRHLEIWLHPLAPHHSSGKITLLEDTKKSKYQTSTDKHHSEREEHRQSEETEDTATFITSTHSTESQEPNSAETESTFWQSTWDTEKISTIYTEETFRHNKDTSNKQGEVTVSKVKTDNIGIFTHRNVVQISETTSEERREEKDLRTTDINTLPDHQLATHLIPSDRFFHVSTVLSTVIEESDTEDQTETEPESDIAMNSGIAVLNTTLNRPSSTHESREDVMVVRKVSLVSTDNKGSLGNHDGLLDSIGLRDQSEQSKASPELWRRWESLHSSSEEKQSNIMKSSDYKLTDRTYLHSSQMSPSYEKTVYTSHFRSPKTLETEPTAFLETAGSLGNSSWKDIESEVQLCSESYSSVKSGAELSTPVRARKGEGEQIRKEGFDSQASLDSSLIITETDESFSGIFKATRIELPPSPTTPDTPSNYSLSEIDSLVDTLKNMDRPIRQRVQRTPSNTPFSSLPPIEEDAPISSPTPVSPVTEPKKILNGVSSLPPDIGLNWSSPKDMRSPLTMMKEQQSGESPSRGLTLPLRASALSSIVMHRSSLTDLSPEEGSTTGLVNGGGLLSPSRLENSFFFQPTENSKNSNRSIFRAASLPDIGNSHTHISSAPKGTESVLGSRFERFSYLTSPANSLSGTVETSRMSAPPSIQPNSAIETSNFSHKSSLEVYRSLPSESFIKNSQSVGLQRSSSVDGGFLFNDTKAFQVNQKQEPEHNLALKYRAFPDAYLTKEKEHGKLNPRPGKMLIFDQPGLTGQRIEVRGDVVDATLWEFTDVISIRVIRGGWVLYEKPDFKGERVALDEGDIDLSNPFQLPEEDEEVHEQNGTAQENGEEDQESKPQPKRTFVIGSIRRAVRDYSVPEISLFPEENAEGKKITFRDTSDDARIFGFPIKANSIIINAGLWLVFAEPFFQGIPRVLEVGGFPNPAAWGVTHPFVSSLHPLKIGEPRVENLYEPKIVIYEKPYFTGKSREIYTSMRDFMTRIEREQSLFLYSAGSIKVTGGCWVGYEKEGFRGHHYLLEEGEYHDWRVWGGVNSELRSVRIIQADLSEPVLVLFGMPEEAQEGEEEPTFEVMEAVADVELFGFGINTRSIHVLSGAWVAYSHVDFSGNQYVLEKGFYNNCGDWGSGDNRIGSLQPILPAPTEGPIFRNEVLLYSKPNFQGTCRVCHQNQGCLPENLLVKSCRVVGGSWVLFEEEQFTGHQYVLSQGDYPNLSSMGCPPDCNIRSVKAVPMTFAVPSISLFGLECFEGREVTFDMQVTNMQEEGFNTQYLSVRVNSGCWVLCEHSNYRGRQFLLEPIEITNWHKFSSLSNIGSFYPVRQKQRQFRIRNKDTGHYISVQGGVEDMKTGRVVVSEKVEGMSDVWLYQDGLIKNKLARSMSLQVMGNVESGAKVVLWTETRVPVQTWSAQVSGMISSVNFPGMVLEIKGGKSYDRQHLVIREENEEQGSQQWDLEFV